MAADEPSPASVTPGTSPVILAFPHVGTWLPEAVRERLTTRGRLLTDTDWYVDALYEGLWPSATTVRATFHRYVIDANRPPDDSSLYPGQATTGLVPLTDFDGEPLWTAAPTADDVATRLARYHRPYHDALQAEIARVRAMHGVAIVYDCHSIRSVVPRLFDGVLPDLNIGTAHGRTCDPRIEALAVSHCTTDAYRSVLNGRFTGGWTTRHYGRPTEGVHALQMEIAQRTHLLTETPPYVYDAARAAPLRTLLRGLLAALHTLAPTLSAPR
jgi:N-formylglutamate deformylase